MFLATILRISKINLIKISFTAVFGSFSFRFEKHLKIDVRMVYF